MRAIAGPGHVSNEFVDYDAVTNPTGTVVTADWANDVQDELLGIQDDAGIAEAAGTNKYVLSAIKYEAIRYSNPLRALVAIPGNAKAPSAFDKDNPGDFFPAFCMTNIDSKSTSIAAANFPDLVPDLRTVRTTYKEGQTGETYDFGLNAWAIVSNVATVDFDANTAEDDILAAFAEWQLDHGGYSDFHTITFPSAFGDIPAGDYEISDIDPSGRTMSFPLTASDNSGTGTAVANFYPHRIAGSTTTARLHSLSGKVAMGAGTTEVMSYMLRRDRMQGFVVYNGINDSDDDATYNYGGTTDDVTSGGRINDTVVGTASHQGKTSGPKADGTNGEPRTGTDTHSPDFGAHFYLWAQRYSA